MTSDVKRRSRQFLYLAPGLLLALGVPALPLSKWVSEFRDIHHLIGYEAIWWALTALVVTLAIALERASPRDIGFKAPTKTDVLLGIAGGGLGIVALAGLFFYLLPLLHLDETPALSSLAATPLWWRIISVIRAAVCEEVLFRGYAISRLCLLTKSSTAAAIISWAIFTVEHVTVWGWGHLLIAGFGGLLLTVLFRIRSSLTCSIVAHLIIDGAAVL